MEEDRERGEGGSSGGVLKTLQPRAGYLPGLQHHYQRRTESQTEPETETARARQTETSRALRCNRKRLMHDGGTGAETSKLQMD